MISRVLLLSRKMNLLRSQEARAVRAWRRCSPPNQTCMLRPITGPKLSEVLISTRLKVSQNTSTSTFQQERKHAFISNQAIMIMAPSSRRSAASDSPTPATTLVTPPSKSYAEEINNLGVCVMLSISPLGIASISLTSMSSGSDDDDSTSRHSSAVG